MGGTARSRRGQIGSGSAGAPAAELPAGLPGSGCPEELVLGAGQAAPRGFANISGDLWNDDLSPDPAWFQLCGGRSLANANSNGAFGFGSGKPRTR